MNHPKEVESILRFFNSKKLWFILSENPKVVSCGDAASKRNRLGHTGIPIFDELKSELGFFINKEKQQQRILVHCRGNQKLDRLKISNILNSEYQRISNPEDVKGLINPFAKNYRNLLQIFDVSLTQKFHPPYTMMTNAGDFNFAIEFDVNSLVKRLKHVIVDDVIRYDNYNTFVKHKIGILTGNGPDSGILLWKQINDEIKNKLTTKLFHSFRGDLSYPEVYVESVPEMGVSMELDKRLGATESAVVKSVISLCERGASIICIACNTTQYFKTKIEEVCSLYNAKFISIPKVVEDYLLRKNIREFDFLGISYVADFDKYSAFKSFKNTFKITIPKKRSLEKMSKAAFDAKKGDGRAANLLRDIIKQESKHDTIVIALTEISTVLATHKKLIDNKTSIDSLQLLADAISDLYIDGIFDTLYIDKEKDTIVYERLNSRTKLKAKSELWNILCEIDYEFIPPLSYRDSTTYSFDNASVESALPEAYFDKLLKQEIIVSRKKTDNQIVGFMSYIPDYLIELDEIKLQCHYISTIGVTKGARGNGITNQFYKILDKIVQTENTNSFIATRTWSTNKSHIRILLSLGYNPLREIKNDRGNGIHTNYFYKEIVKKNLLSELSSISP